MSGAAGSDAVTKWLLNGASFACRVRGWRDHRSAARREMVAERTRFYRDAWDEAVAAAGGRRSELGGGLLEIDCGGARLRVSNNLTSLDDAVTLRLAGDKPLVYGLLEERGIPVPVHAMCPSSDLSRARSFLASVGRPCVVKPARRTGAGAGVTTGVTTVGRLVAALARAGALCNEVVIEEEIEGDDLRLLYLDGELLDSVRRMPPVVRADGVSSIRQLVDAENADRLRRGAEAGQTLIGLDTELRGTLRGQGYGLQSVPAAGTVIKLKGVVNDNRGDDNLTVSNLSDDVVEVGAQAALVVGARLAGVDVITPDPSQPLAACGGVVIEVNTTPGYYYHYHKRDGRVPVATMILERLAGARA